MSEYQYYEFLAIDRPLDEREQGEVRSLSTRARITPTSFVNEYHWGDFRGDPNRLMERYYDAHLYVANWGTRRLMVRLPSDLLELDVVEDYCIDSQLTVRATSESLVLSFAAEDEAGEFDLDEAPETMLSSVVGVRAELAAGDLRSLYLGWLAAYGAWERDEEVFDRDADDDREPAIPPGLGTLTAAQQALAHFLRLDDDLVAVAARRSPPVEPVTDDPDTLLARAARLPVAEKDRVLAQVLRGEVLRARTELLRRLRDDDVPTAATAPRRTVAELLDDAARCRAERRRQDAARHAEQEARRQAARAEARERRLDTLAREGDAAWSRVEAMIATRKPTEYDAAVAVLTDLQALAERDGEADGFVLRTLDIRRAHARKPSLIARLDRARL